MAAIRYLQRARRDQRGQILPLFAFGMVALFAMAVLLFDAAEALVLRRRLQDAGDAAALAAANVIQSGTPRACSATAGPPPGAPRAVVRDAAVASIAANLPSYPAGNVVVTCPANWDNGAVRVQLTQSSPSYFRRVIGAGALTVNTSSSAVNGFTSGNGYSVITLNPGNMAWNNLLRGCPSMLFAGSPDVTFMGNVQINSSCLNANGGALSQSGNASVVTMGAGKYVDVVGTVRPNQLTILPSVRENRPVLPDPLAGLPPVNVASLPVRSASQLILNNAIQTIQPGIYTGGIRLRNNSILYMRPGIYVLQPTAAGANGGLLVDAQASIYTLSPTALSATIPTWAITDCPTATCGVLIYNRANGGAVGQIDVTAGATVQLRGYNFDADTGPARQYEYTGLLFWQDRLPLPTSTTIQPEIRLNGGGTVNMVGTIYGPSAPMRLGGTSGGGGGFDLDYPMQFIVWDLSFQGTTDWRFQYTDQSFVRPPDYGLIE